MAELEPYSFEPMRESSGSEEEEATEKEGRPYRLSKWRWGSRTASGNGSLRAIYLGGQSRGSFALATHVFLAGNHISDDERDKEQERAGGEEVTKFEKFKRRNPREKPRKEKKIKLKSK